MHGIAPIQYCAADCVEFSASSNQNSVSSCQKYHVTTNVVRVYYNNNSGLVVRILGLVASPVCCSGPVSILDSTTPRHFGPYAQRAIARSSSIRIETTSGSGVGLIRIGSGVTGYLVSLGYFVAHGNFS